jgi:hypothetical protein
LASLCRARREPLEHVRALVRARRLPQPAAVNSEGTELVRRDYFRLVDAAGGVREIERFFFETYAPALAAKGGKLRGGSVQGAWQAYLDGDLKIDVGLLHDPLAVEPESGSWHWHLWRELRRFRDGERRLAGADGPEAARRREQQLMRIGSAAWGAGLALLMLAREDEARSWLDRSALCYRRCLAEAEPGAWGRSIGALKARLIAGDLSGAVREAEWTLDLGPERADSTIATYAGCLSLLTVGEDRLAETLATVLANDPAFPPATARACAALAQADGDAYEQNLLIVLRTFEERVRFLEDIPVADTVLTLQVLGEQRAMRCPLTSTHLPATD